MLDEPAKLRFGFHVFVLGEVHFGQVVLVVGLMVVPGTSAPAASCS